MSHELITSGVATPGPWPILAALTDSERQAIISSARRRSFEKNEVVYNHGDPAQSMLLIARGFLAVRLSDAEGAVGTLRILGPGSHVGELALIDREGCRTRSASVLALETTEALVITAPMFEHLCTMAPGIRGLLLDLLAERIRELSTALLDAIHVPLDRRLFRALLDLAGTYRGAGPDGVIPLTQDQLAEIIGGTRASVNQHLRSLQGRGVVRIGRGRVTVLEHESLLELV